MSTATQIVRCFCFSDSQAAGLVRRAYGLSAAVRSINPGGAAAIFALAFIAGMIGSFSAALVALALLAGLQLARIQPVQANEATAAVESDRVASGPHLPLSLAPADGMECFGLPVKQVVFAKPVAQKAPKVDAA